MGVGSTCAQEFKGRMEERLVIAVIVQLAPVEGARTRALVEVGFTLNISPHGAYVVSSYPWEKGDLTDVTSLNDRTTLRGEVVHCQRRDCNRYGIGLNFIEQALNWSVFAKASR